MSDNLTFQDTPLYAWLRANRWFLLAGVGILIAISVYRHQAPKMRLSGERASWDQFLTLSDPAAGADSLATRLAQAKQDSRIYPWFVFNAVREASSNGDQASLDLLRPELKAIEASDQVMVASANGPQKMSSFLLSRMESSGPALPTDFPLPEPEGRRIEVSLSVDGTSTYSVVFGLYEAASPVGTAAIMSWVEQGRFNEQAARKIGVTGVTLSMPEVSVEEGAEAPAPIMAERSYGLFHSAGVLTMMQLPGKGGQQDPNSVQILLGDAFYQDGYSTVVGKAVEGWSEFEAAITALEDSAKLRVTAVRILQ